MKKVVYIGEKSIEYELTYKNVKNLNMRVKSDGTVVVSANRSVSAERIEKFIAKNSDTVFEFIKKNKLKSHPESYKYENGESVNFLGKAYVVEVKRGKMRKVEILDDKFEITLLGGDDDNTKVKFVKNWYNDKFKEICRKIDKKVAYEYEAYAVGPAKEIKFRKMVSMWGNCKISKGVITINTRLIYYPYECIEAVFVHEYAHFLFYYHDEKFYKVVNDIMPTYKIWDKVLKDAKWG